MKREGDPKRRENSRLLRITVGLALLLNLALLDAGSSATAQYMYLDVDGDGASTINDAAALAGGEPTRVDLYLRTNSSPYAGTATCAADPSAALGLNSYTVNIYSLDAPVSFTNVVNQVPGMVETIPLVTYPYALSVGFSGTETLPPGTYHLLSMTVTILPTTLSAGCPSLAIVPSSCYSPPGVITSFGSNCPGQYGDGVLRLGTDWIDTGNIFMCTDNTGRSPTVLCAAEIHGVEGETITFTGSVIDPDCYVPSFYTYSLPPGATMSVGAFVAGQADATVTWTPSVGQAGVYSVTFEASDPDPFNMRDRRSQCMTTITVGAANRQPVADAGGPYSGDQGVPISFDGTGSSDPEGGPLEYVWSFGDGETSSGGTPVHVYENGGNFTVTLTVTEAGGLSSHDETTASIAVPVRVFTTASNRVTRLMQGKPLTCFQIESPALSEFEPEDVVPSSLSIHSKENLCDAADGSAVAIKSSTVSDTDRNGLLEYEACFTRESLAALVSCLPGGTHTVALEIFGSLASGTRIHGEVSHMFTSGSGRLSAGISQNPLRSSSALEFTTESTGFVKARLFDVQGRLVANLADETSMEPGYHRIPLFRGEGIGARLASGIYFVRLITEHDGAETRTVTLLR